MNAQLKEKFFHPGYDVVVFPGVLLQSTSGLVIKRPKVTWTLGSDFFLQSKEKFSKIYAPENIKSLLDTDKAKRGTLYQSTLWITLNRNKRPDSQWDYGVRAAVAGCSSGIGQSIGFALYIKKLF